MKKEYNGPARDRTRCQDNNKVAVHEFKPCDMPARPIDTRYKGYRFRSRLEARWAVYFDALHIKWEYEFEGYDLGPAGWYLPDFWLPEASTWAEVKPVALSPAELEKVHRLGDLTGNNVLMLVGVPAFKTYIRYSPKYGDSAWGGVAVCWLNDTKSFYEFMVGPDTGIPDLNRYSGMADRILPGVNAARSARFEHGEQGGRC